MPQRTNTGYDKITQTLRQKLAKVTIEPVEQNGNLLKIMRLGHFSFILNVSMLPAGLCPLILKLLCEFATSAFGLSSSV